MSYLQEKLYVCCTAVEVGQLLKSIYKAITLCSYT